MDNDSAIPPNAHDKDGRTIIRVQRPLYSQNEFDASFNAQKRSTMPLRKWLRTQLHNAAQSASIKAFLLSFFPFITIFQGYRLSDLISDAVAGLTVGVMHIPQGMAYGLLTTLPPVYGLYTSFFPVIIYFFFGTSRHISIGTFAVVSLLVGNVVSKSHCDTLVTSSVNMNTTTADYNSTDSPNTVIGGVSPDVLDCKVRVAITVTFLAGLIQLLLGVLQMGFVTMYLSEPLTRGFTTGAAVLVLSSQIKHIFGTKPRNYTGPLNLVYFYQDFFMKIKMTNPAALLMGIICMVIMYVGKEYISPKVKKKIRVQFPIELILVLLGSLISYLGHFENRFRMIVVGNIPQGIPPPRMPYWPLMGSMATDAFSIAIVAFANNFAMGKLFANKHSYDLNSNQELLASGLSNIGSCFFNSFASAASLSRSLVQENSGGKTQLAGLVSCSLLLIVFYGVGRLFAYLPNNVLAAIVIVNLKGMFLQVKDIPQLWRINKYDCAIWIVMFLAVVLLDVDMGLLVGVVFSLLTVIYRSQAPYTCRLGRVGRTDLYRDVKVYAGAQEIPGITIFRFEAPLYYANSEHFIKKLWQKSGVNPRIELQRKQKREKKMEEKRRKLEKEKKKKEKKKVTGDGTEEVLHTEEIKLDPEDEVTTLPISNIVIDCSSMSFIDSVGIKSFSQVVEEYKRIGIKVLLAAGKASLREQLDCGGFFDTNCPDCLFVTIHDAVLTIFKTDKTVQNLINRSPSPVMRHHSVFQTENETTQCAKPEILDSISEEEYLSPADDRPNPPEILDSISEEYLSPADDRPNPPEILDSISEEYLSPADDRPNPRNAAYVISDDSSESSAGVWQNPNVKKGSSKSLVASMSNVGVSNVKSYKSGE